MFKNLSNNIINTYKRIRNSIIVKIILGIIVTYFFIFRILVEVPNSLDDLSSAAIGRKKIKPNDFNEQTIEIVEDEKRCIFDDSEWAQGYGQLQKIESGVYSLASTTQSSLLRYERSISSNAEIFFSFIPLSGSSPNVAITAHDLFEIVVGDEGDRRVTVKANLVEGNSMSLIPADNESGKSFLLPQGLAIGTEVIVKIAQRPVTVDKHELILSITYDPQSDPTIKTYHFPIPSEFEVSDKPILVSVGIINTENKEDIKIRFKCFKISLNDINSDATSMKSQSDKLDSLASN